MGIRTGRDYLQGLNDGRQVFFDGRLLGDVTKEPAFSRSSRAIAQFYDFQSQPDMLEMMTYEMPEGGRAGTAFLLPRTKDDLVRRSAAYAAWAEVTCGFMGRSPDYMNTAVSALGGSCTLLGKLDPELEKRSWRIYVESRERDSCLTHTFTRPFKMSDDPTDGLKVVRETGDGFYITGARGVATLAPFADANFNMAIAPSQDVEGMARVCSFLVPVNAQGLRWVCRETFGTGRAHAASPLASRCDEMDCTAIFEECFIPWENVFAYARGPVLLQAAPAFSSIGAALRHHMVTRAIAKTRFIIGLAHLMAESAKLVGFLNVQERLADLLQYLRTMEAFALASIQNAAVHPETGICNPDPVILDTAVRFYSRHYLEMVRFLLDLGGSRHVSQPHERTLDVLGPSIEDYFRGATHDARENVSLYALAWDIAGSEWGIRQDLYERFHFGDNTRGKLRAYSLYDKSDAINMVRRILSTPPTSEHPFPEPPQRRPADGSTP
jgi:4-hydroxyphenylacetate 3-monooxygenase